MTEPQTEFNIGKIEARLDSQDSMLKLILDEVRKTNGRVSRHDERLLDIDKELAENRGKARTHGLLWGFVSSALFFLLNKIWR
jgi:hypothetical protein